MSDDVVRFQKTAVAVVGLFLSAAIGFGLPTVILIYGQNLGVAVQTTLIILALVGGTTLGIVSAFFGIVIPSRVGSIGGLMPFHLKKVVAKADGEKEVEFQGPPAQAQDGP
jgi:hypothetical protein